jgi:hypothetical protein
MGSRANDIATHANPIKPVTTQRVISVMPESYADVFHKTPIALELLSAGSACGAAGSVDPDESDEGSRLE